MKKCLIFICLLFIINSCDIIYQGTIIKMEKVDDYYFIDYHNHYETRYRTVYGYDFYHEDWRFKQESYDVYIGTTFTVIYLYPNYEIEVEGYTKKEKKIKEKFYFSKEEFGKYKIVYNLILRDKNEKWYQDTFKYKRNKIYGNMEIEKRIINGSNKDMVYDEFDINIKPLWIEKYDLKE